MACETMHTSGRRLLFSTLMLLSAYGCQVLGAPVSQQTNAGLLGVDRPGHVVLGANDLGMHCADQDDQIFSVLPPFNVLHAQVIRRGLDGNEPVILSGADVAVTYSAASSARDPVGPDSINSTSANLPDVGGTPQVYKGNFWDIDLGTGNPLGFEVYSPLYFGLLPANAVVQDRGLPTAESTQLTRCLPPPFGTGAASGIDCRPSRQALPGVDAPYLANDPQPMRFDADFNFFNGSLSLVDGVGGRPLGALISGVKWFRADGIPILPIDDQGRSNAYPLVRVQALRGGVPVASTDVVLPVAAEADCQGCHLDPNTLCTSLGLTCEGVAASFADTSFAVVDLNDAEDRASTPGATDEQKVLNAAKINILRLHDAKWGTSLDVRRKIVCASCHYSPALDLAQVGPQDTGLTEQRQHISMSRAMHAHHGALTFNGAKVFPDMPPPDQRTPDQAQQILQDTCYQCHPGKRTQCLRGAMGGAGIVCQDCHGSMSQVGNDASADFPDASLTTLAAKVDLTKRIPWVSEPKCQSCHTGDALTPNHPPGAVVAADGIRLRQAYVASEHASAGGNARPIVSPGSPFGENQTLYRLSGNDDQTGKGHGGIMCEGCHGSTHAIWPNANPNANDNVAATQLQGHAGTLIECSTCHERDLGNTLRGPHGMHPVGATRFVNGGHEDLAEGNLDACRRCHGTQGQGTVLSEAKATRTGLSEVGTIAEGTLVGCGHCHGNPLDGSGGGDDD